MNDLMSKLDATEADLAKMTDEIHKVQEVIETTEAKIKDLNEDEQVDLATAGNHFKEDNLAAQSANRDANGPVVGGVSPEEADEVSKPGQKKVNVKVTNYSPAKLAGLEVIILKLLMFRGCFAMFVSVKIVFESLNESRDSGRCSSGGVGSLGL